jgi:hypothetical protein
MTPGHRFETALACQSKEEASRWFVRSINEVTREKGMRYFQAAEQVAFFLGFMAGYYNDPETSAKIKDLFGMDWAVFGSPTEKIDDHRRRKARRGK